MKQTIEINETNFALEVLQSNQPVVVDFWAEWCGPCKMLAPVLEEIATERAGRVKIAKANVDTNPVLAARFGIQSIPDPALFWWAAKCGIKPLASPASAPSSPKFEKLAVPASKLKPHLRQ